MARLNAVNDANSVLTAILYAADANMHITTGSGNAQGFPTAGDWMMRIQYATSAPAYDSTKEQWEIVRATLRPATAHGTDYDTIDITRVSEGADAPTDWPVGSVVYNVVGKEYWEELLAEIDLKAPSTNIALSALATQAAQTINANATDGAAAPTAVAIAASQIVARLAAGNLKGCSVAEILTLLNVAAGATAVTVEDTATDGHTTQAASSNVAYDIKTTADAALPKAGGPMTGDITLPEVGGILEDGALSADGKYSMVDGEVGVGGAVIAFGKMVYFNSAGKWVLTDADAEATTKGRCGMCVVACGGDTQAITVMFIGKVREDDWNWATVGAPLFLDATTAGDLTETAPGSGKFVRIGGYVIDANTVDVRPSTDWMELV